MHKFHHMQPSRISEPLRCCADYTDFTSSEKIKQGSYLEKECSHRKPWALERNPIGTCGCSYANIFKINADPLPDVQRSNLPPWLRAKSLLSSLGYTNRGSTVMHDVNVMGAQAIGHGWKIY